MNTKQFLLTATGLVYGLATAAAPADVLSPAPATSTSAHPDSAVVAEEDKPGSSVADSSLDEIQVTGYRASLDAARLLKKNSAEVIEAISPEDLGKFSDNSIADALQRVPGVQIDRDTDGRSGDHVSIRGIGAEFITTTVNGRTPGGYGHEGLSELRQFPLDVLPGEVLSGTIVYKTTSAEMIESGLGGEIDFQTLKPLDYMPKSGGDFYGSITAKGQNNSNGSDISYGNGLSGKGISGVFGGKLLDQTLGFYASATVSRNRYSEDADEVRPQYQNVNIENAAGGVTTQNVLFPSLPLYQNIRRQEDRDALSTGAQWKPNSALDVNLDYTYSKFDRSENRDVFGVNYGPTPGTFLPGGISIQNGAVTGFNIADYVPPAGTTGSYANNFFFPLIYDNSATSQIGGLNVKWEQGPWSAAVDYSLNKTDFLQNLSDAYIPGTNFPNATTNYQVNPNGPAAFNVGTAPITPSELAGPYFLGQDFTLTKIRGDSFKLDGAYQANDDIKIKLGTRYSEMDVDTRYFSASGSCSSVQACQSAIFPGGVDNIFPGYALGMNTQPHQDFANFLATNPGALPSAGLNSPPFTGDFDGNSTASYDFDPKQSHLNHERTLAGYGQVDNKGSIFGMDFRSNAGLRVVHTEETAEGFQGITYVDFDNHSTGRSAQNLVASENNYTTFLPSANLTIFPWTDIDMRFAVGRTVSRPEFADMSPTAVISVPDPKAAGYVPGAHGTGTTDNPNLRPETAWNVDWTVEYYSEGVSIIGSTFYKRVSDFIAPISVANTTVPGQGALLFNLTEPENVSGGKAYGAEFDVNVPLKNYIPALDGFGVVANYTRVNSEIDRPLDATGYKSPFPGSSKNNVNGTVYYGQGPYEMRVAVVYRSDYLSAFPTNPNYVTPVYTEGSTTLDLSANYAITKNFGVTFTGSNLTGANRRDYAYNHAAFLNYYTVPRILALSLRASF